MSETRKTTNRTLNAWVQSVQKLNAGNAEFYQIPRKGGRAHAQIMQEIKKDLPAPPKREKKTKPPIRNRELYEAIKTDRNSEALTLYWQRAIRDAKNWQFHGGDGKEILKNYKFDASAGLRAFDDPVFRAEYLRRTDPDNALAVVVKRVYS